VGDAPVVEDKAVSDITRKLGIAPVVVQAGGAGGDEVEGEVGGACDRAGDGSGGLGRLSGLEACGLGACEADEAEE